MGSAHELLNFLSAALCTQAVVKNQSWNYPHIHWVNKTAKKLPRSTNLGKGSIAQIICLAIGLTLPGSVFGQAVIRVSTAEELVLSIEPGRTIVLEPGEYYLSEAKGIDTRHVAWEEVFDGQQLLIHDVFDLTIMGEHGATILAEPRYSYVFSILDSAGVSLINLTIGHTEAGYCSGGVVRLEGCEEVDLQGCDLYGSGTVGIEIIDSAAVLVRDLLISECTYGAVWIQECAGIRFSEIEISQNEAFALIDIGTSTEIVFENSWIGYNYGYAMLRLDEQSCPVVFDNITFEANETDFFADEGSPLPELFACIFTDNTFSDPFADLMLEEIEELGYNPDYDYMEEGQKFPED